MFLQQTEVTTTNVVNILKNDTKKLFSEKSCLCTSRALSKHPRANECSTPSKTLLFPHKWKKAGLNERREGDCKCVNITEEEKEGQIKGGRSTDKSTQILKTMCTDCDFVQLYLLLDTLRKLNSFYQSIVII